MNAIDRVNRWLTLMLICMLAVLLVAQYQLARSHGGGASSGAGTSYAGGGASTGSNTVVRPVVHQATDCEWRDVDAVRCR